MSFTHTVYIIAINGGHVVEADNTGKEIKTQKATVSKSQQWVVERKDAHKADEFALRNVATNAYLGAPKTTANSIVYMWQKDDGWVQSMLWYLRDVNDKGLF
ncbi:hypothetical protein HRS9139_05396 [Pyrenophora teres f. teres]|nr:hypothetical protein HRS9139_05396 [Pyrenophora teres f. teres]